MTENERQEYRDQAATAKSRMGIYHDNKVASDWPEDRKFWEEREREQELLYQLNASLAGIENE